MKNFFLANFENVKKKRFETSFQSNPVIANGSKVHFFTFAMLFEKYLFSLAFYGKFAINQMKILCERSQPFFDFFLFFLTDSEPWANTFQQGCPNYNQSVHWNILKKSLFNEQNFFWKFLPISSKKSGIFSHFFGTVVEKCFIRVQKIALRRKKISKSFLILIFALPENWFRT